MIIIHEKIDRLSVPPHYSKPLFDAGGRDKTLVDSIRIFDVLEPLTVRESDGVIVHGVRRYWASEYLHKTKVPVIYQPNYAADEVANNAGRGVSLYAACIAVEYVIRDLLAIHDPYRRRDGFIGLEHDYGWAEGDLTAGYELLRSVRRYEASDDPIESGFGFRIRSAFQNYGYGPAQKILTDLTPSQPRNQYV